MGGGRLLGGHGFHRTVESICVLGGDDDTILAVYDNLTRAVDIGDDAGELHSACLHHGIGEAFAVAGKHEAVARGIVGQQVIAILGTYMFNAGVVDSYLN